jgi:hypothetical protein
MSSGNAIFFLVVVLLPLIPAYLLFRLLPSQAEVEGPWQGLKVKLTGAFASYFLLVITLIFMAGAPPTYDVWTIQGRLQFRDQPAGTFDENTVRFTVKPPGLTVQPNGRFRFTVFRVPDPSGEPQLPMVIIEHPGYLPVGVDLSEQGEVSQRKRQVVLPDTIVLVPRPAVAAPIQ